MRRFERLYVALPCSATVGAVSAIRPIRPAAMIAGKTHTILGSAGRGLFGRTIRHVLAARKANAHDQHTLHVSLLDVRNDVRPQNSDAQRTLINR